MKFLFVTLLLVAVAAAGEVERNRRFLFNIIKRCSTEADCPPGRCCLFGKVCSLKLLKYSTCHLVGIHQCGCADGLECRVTKEFDILGQKIQIRQCMESGVRTAVEKLEEEEVSELASEREKRFLVDRCSSESDCGPNRCCLFGKFCARKLPKDMTCYLSHKHKCGCQDGLVCKETTSITIPIIGTKIPIRQCVEPDE